MSPDCIITYLVGCHLNVMFVLLLLFFMIFSPLYIFYIPPNAILNQEYFYHIKERFLWHILRRCSSQKSLLYNDDCWVFFHQKKNKNMVKLKNENWQSSTLLKMSLSSHSLWNYNSSGREKKCFKNNGVNSSPHVYQTTTSCIEHITEEHFNWTIVDFHINKVNIYH